MNKTCNFERTPINSTDTCATCTDIYTDVCALIYKGNYACIYIGVYTDILLVGACGVGYSGSL